MLYAITYVWWYELQGKEYNVYILSVYYICKYVDKYIAYVDNLIDIVDNFKDNVDNYMIVVDNYWKIVDNLLCICIPNFCYSWYGYML